MVLLAFALLTAATMIAAPPSTSRAIFVPADRAVSTWRGEAVANLLLSADESARLQGPGVPPPVARCVKLNNYWCIKKAGWNGEIAADAEGHVAFSTAVEGAAVAALLLRRYYVDFNRRTALAIVAHWAPAPCGSLATIPRTTVKSLALRGLGSTLRAHWLASHARGFALPIAGRRATTRRSTIADRLPRPMATPTIAAGLGEASRPMRPMTLDALLMASANAPPSRSMLGMPRAGTSGSSLSVSACGNDAARIAAYAAKAAAGLRIDQDGDLGLFEADGTPTPNLALMMANMAKVEIGPLGATDALVGAGIAEAFKPSRNPARVR